MDWFSFGLLLNDNIVLYGIILFITIILYFFLFKKLYISILDPLIFSTVFSCFGFSVVLFLYFTQSILLKYLVSYLFTQVAFWIGLFSFKSLTIPQIIEKQKIIKFQNEELLVKIFFIITSFLYISIQLISYIVVGIPLLLGTHIDIYSNSGGWGILGHFLDVIKPVSIFLLIHFLLKKSTSYFLLIYKYFFGLLILIFTILSASKGEFMSIGLILFCYLILNGYNLKRIFSNLKRIEIQLILVGIVFVFITIVAQSKLVGDDSNAIGVFLFRLVAAGDTYYFSYPNANIESISGSNSFLALFGSILSIFRIIPFSAQPVVLGVQLYRMFGDTDLTAGPNARHNVFGYVYFGFYGSIIFSYILGFILSFIRNVYYFKLKKNIIGQVLFVLLYTNFVAIETDPPMVISNLEIIILIFPLILLITVIAHLFFIFQPKQQLIDNG